jgi:hypothetical protein
MLLSLTHMPGDRLLFRIDNGRMRDMYRASALALSSDRRQISTFAFEEGIKNTTKCPMRSFGQASAEPMGMPWIQKNQRVRDKACRN